jgi:flagellar protein FlaG
MDIPSVSGSGAPVVANPPSPPVRSAGASPAVSRDLAPHKPLPVPTLEQVQQAMKVVQDMVQTQTSDIQFSLDHATGKTIVMVVDTQTKQVIRQIPSQEMIAIAHAIDQMQQGMLLLKQKA